MRIIALGFAAALTLAACAGGDADKTDTEVDRVADIVALSGDAEAGATVYDGNCAGCHDSESYPDLTATTASDEDIATVILDGAGSMPGFEADLSDQDIADLIAYIASIAA